jgi:hypothetical protein
MFFPTNLVKDSKVRDLNKLMHPNNNKYSTSLYEEAYFWIISKITHQTLNGQCTRVSIFWQAFAILLTEVPLVVTARGHVFYLLWSETLLYLLHENERRKKSASSLRVVTSADIVADWQQSTRSTCKRADMRKFELLVQEPIQST